MTEPLVSIIMRSFNEAWALRDTLRQVAAQDYRNWELIVIDSGSKDGSVEIIREFQPAQFVQILPVEYVPGRVMNRGMELARANYCVFLNADATPQGADWLRNLVTPLFDSQVAAVFGRQIPRPDCWAVYAHDYDRCFGPRRESVNWDHFFSMVSSGVRKDIWARRGFLEKLQYAEDYEYTNWCRQNGYRIVYCENSVVMHSHNYTPAQIYKRCFGDNRALALSWNKDPAHFNWMRTVLLGWASDVRRDLIYCARHGRLWEWPRAARIRWWQHRGLLDGFRSGWQDYRGQTAAAVTA